MNNAFFSSDAVLFTSPMTIMDHLVRLRSVLELLLPKIYIYVQLNQSCFMSHKYYCHLFSCFPPTSPLLHFIMASSIFFIIIFALTFSATIKAGPLPELVRSSCQHATFPKVCFHTLSVYNPPANTPRELALAAIKVSITRAAKVSEYLSGMQKEANKREKGAVQDCATQISDSVDDLRKTLGEIKELKRGTFRWQMSNAETWVSAALTNEDTCLDGFKEVAGTVRSDVKKKVTNVAKVTSNALYLINRLDHA